MMRLRFSLLSIFLFVSCGKNPEPWLDNKVHEVDAWWTDRVFCEILVRSVCNSNGDGFGDLIDVIQELDYLNDVRVTPRNSLF